MATLPTASMPASTGVVARRVGADLDAPAERSTSAFSSTVLRAARAARNGRAVSVAGQQHGGVVAELKDAALLARRAGERAAAASQSPVAANVQVFAPLAPGLAKGSRGPLACSQGQRRTVDTTVKGARAARRSRSTTARQLEGGHRANVRDRVTATTNRTRAKTSVSVSGASLIVDVARGTHW
jgi:hypothetical protein